MATETPGSFTRTMPPKHPLAQTIYTVNMQKPIADAGTGVTLVSAEVTVEDGLTAVGGPTVAGTRIRQKFSDGSDGVNYTATYDGLLSNGEHIIAVLIIPVRSKTPE